MLDALPRYQPPSRALHCRKIASVYGGPNRSRRHADLAGQPIDGGCAGGGHLTRGGLTEQGSKQGSEPVQSLLGEPRNDAEAEIGLAARTPTVHRAPTHWPRRIVGKRDTSWEINLAIGARDARLRRAPRGF